MATRLLKALAVLLVSGAGFCPVVTHAYALDAQFDCRERPHAFIGQLINNRYIDPNPMHVEANSVNAFRPAEGSDITAFGFRVYAVLGYEQDDGGCSGRAPARRSRARCTAPCCPLPGRRSNRACGRQAATLPCAWKACALAQSSFCGTGFTVATLNPDTMATTLLYHGAPGILAGASVGVQLDNALYVGSFMGDRVLKIALRKSHEGDLK